MLWYPFLLLVRKRLIATAILSLVVAILAAHTDNAGTLFFFVCILLGIFLGSTGVDRGIAEMRFLLTRPIPRLAAFLRPFAIGAFAIALFPLVTFLLMLGLRYLGTHLSRPSVVATMDLARAYRTDVQVSLIAYAVIALGRWEALSQKWIRALASYSGLLFLGGLFLLRPWRSSRGAVEYLLLSIILIAGLCSSLYGAWRVLQSIDELPEPGHFSTNIEEKIRALRAAREAR